MFTHSSTFVSDVTYFTAPCSLDMYLKQWTKDVKKSVFPYTFFHSIEELRQTVDFPPYDAFYSELKRSNVAKEDYDEAKNLYESRLNLPENDPEKWSNFADWLRFYNVCDVGPLVKAIQSQFIKFRTYFNIEPLAHYSLPGMATRAMWNNFDFGDF